MASAAVVMPASDDLADDVHVLSTGDEQAAEGRRGSGDLWVSKSDGKQGEQ